MFEFTAPSVGKPMKKIRIGHDGAGLGAGWHLARVIVENLRTGECVTFECNRWFDKGEDDGAIERDLFPSSSIVDGVNWKLTIVTGATCDSWICVPAMLRLRWSAAGKVLVVLAHRSKATTCAVRFIALSLPAGGWEVTSNPGGCFPAVLARRVGQRRRHRRQRVCGAPGRQGLLRPPHSHRAKGALSAASTCVTARRRPTLANDGPPHPPPAGRV